MAQIFRSFARLVTAMTIVFGVRPRVVSLLDVSQPASVRLVAITQRRRPEYAAFFVTGAASQESVGVSTGRLSPQPGPFAGQHSPIHRPARCRYTPVRTA